MIRAMTKLSRTINLRYYFFKWNYKLYQIKKFFDILRKKMLKNNKKILKAKLFTNKLKNKSQFIYSRTIISKASTKVNIHSSKFSYYCKINKSSPDNDYILSRQFFGLKLLYKIFVRKFDIEFLSKLKRKFKLNHIK